VGLRDRSPLQPERLPDIDVAILDATSIDRRICVNLIVSIETEHVESPRTACFVSNRFCGLTG
jgi:hypothetical protein